MQREGAVFKERLTQFAKKLKEFCIQTIGNLKIQKNADPRANFKFWLATVKDSLDAVYNEFI